MRTCEEYEALISALLDGALADEDREELMAHMAGCPACQAYFDDLLAIRTALSGLEDKAPAGFTDRVMDQVRRESRQTEEKENSRKTVAFPYWRRYAAMAACCAVVAIAGFWAFNGAQPSAGNVAADTASLMDSRSAPVAEDQEADAAGSGGSADAAGGDAAADGQIAPADSGEQTAPETAAEGTEEQDAGEPETFSVTTTEPETDSTDADSGSRGDARPGTYSAGKNSDSAGYTTADIVTLTTDSPLAEAWVAENLGETWEPGASYALTVEQFDQVQVLLQANGESFLLSMPTEEPPANTALDAGPEETEDGRDGAEEPAASGDDVPADESGEEPVVYVLQAAP